MSDKGESEQSSTYVLTSESSSPSPPCYTFDDLLSSDTPNPVTAWLAPRAERAAGELQAPQTTPTLVPQTRSAPPLCQLCGVDRHPSWWSLQTVSKVHQYSFLLDIPGGDIDLRFVVVSSADLSQAVCSVPLEMGSHPLVKLAEYAIRYTDVEEGVGDMTPFDSNYYSQPPNRKVFLLVSGRRRVDGLVVAEPMARAARILWESRDGRQRRLRAEACTKVVVGVNRVWVRLGARRQRWATILCDLVRHRFYEGRRLSKSELAFNAHTAAGVSFAKSYLGRTRVPIYEGKTGSVQFWEPHASPETVEDQIDRDFLELICV